MTVYTEVPIREAHGGFGEYQCGEKSISPQNSCGVLRDLECMCGGLPLEDALLDQDYVDAGVEDISGRVHNRPSYIYAKIVPDYQMDEDGNLAPGVQYFGIDEDEVPEDFYGSV